MSSDERINDYHHNTKSHYHQQLSPKKLHHQPLSIHNGNVNVNDLHATHNGHHLSIASTSTQTNNCCDINGIYNGGTIKRRKSTSIGSLATPTNVRKMFKKKKIHFIK